MSGSWLPEGWKETPLGRVAGIRRGITYEADMLGAAQGGLPYVNMKSFLKGGGFNHAGTKEYAGAYRRDDLVGERDLLIANTDVTAGDIVGAPALLPGELFGEDVLYSHHVTRLRLDDELWVPFVFHLLCLPQYRSHMQSIARGTTVLMLDMKALKDVPVRAPAGTAEQRRIVEILDTLDEAIRKTEQVIAKLQQMKQGLLHDLLTRGIDEHGELRDPERHPERFKDSPLGRIPKGWEVRPLEGWVRNDAPITYGIVQAGPHVRGGVPYIRTGDMAGTRLRLDGLLRTSRAIANSYRRSEVRAGEIVCAIRATVGKVLPVPDELDGANLTQGTARIAPGSEVDGQFLLWALKAPTLQRQVAAYQKGTTFQEITLGQLRGLLVGVPPARSEQEAIRDALKGLEGKAEAEQGELAKLRTLKHGLMDDLLTGRVRVSVPEAA